MIMVEKLKIVEFVLRNQFLMSLKLIIIERLDFTTLMLSSFLSSNTNKFTSTCNEIDINVIFSYVLLLYNELLLTQLKRLLL